MQKYFTQVLTILLQQIPNLVQHTPRQQPQILILPVHNNYHKAQIISGLFSIPKRVQLLAMWWMPNVFRL